MDISMTVKRGGNIVGSPFEMVIVFSVYKNAMNTKYTLAAFLNYWNKLNGTKLMASYVEVFTTFDLAFSLIFSRLVGSSLRVLVPPIWLGPNPKLSYTALKLALRVCDIPLIVSINQFN